MRSKGFEGMECSIAEVMSALGDRWGLLIMRDLLLGLTRYDDLRHSSGITNATLSDRLKSLEQAGLVTRRLYQTRPDRYDYVPSTRGQDIALILQAMVQVGDTWRRSERLEPPLQFVNAASGHPLTLTLIEKDEKASEQGFPITLKAGPGADDLMQWRIAQGQAERIRRTGVHS